MGGSWIIRRWKLFGFERWSKCRQAASPEVLARALGLRRSTVYSWLAMYRAGGWDALKAKPVTGRPKKISGTQMQWVYTTVVGSNPLQHRFEFALWTRQMIRILLWEQFRLKLSLSSVGRLLAQLGLTCQRPLFRASEQDELKVRRWRENDYPLIRSLAREAHADLLFLDESSIRSDYHSGTTWAKRGETPVVRSTAKRDKVNMISAISPKGEMRFMVFEGKLDAPRFIEFLARLIDRAEASGVSDCGWTPGASVASCQSLAEGCQYREGSDPPVFSPALLA